MPDELKGLMGQQKYREAHQWWLTFDLAVYRYRCWAVRWSLRTRLRARLLRCGFGKSPANANQLADLNRLVDEAYDRLLIESENITMASRAAVACEMAGLIYAEEYEGIESYRMKESDDAE